jgi:hypothetical protein
MYQLVYVSSAANLFSEEQLKDLLDVSRRNNSGRGVTGLLLYLGGNFIQALEGEELDVMQTHLRIARDTRHRGLITLLQGTVEKRNFPDWSMGFKILDPDTNKPPGYNGFLNEKGDPNKQRASALRLLEHFSKTNR